MVSSEGECLALGRYVLFDEIAAGGMASVHIGRMRGPVGFARTVAIKRLHPQFARDRGFVAMIVDEARLAARIHHPNVVATLDVAVLDKEVFLVLDYVHGQSLAALLGKLRDRHAEVPLAVALSIVVAVLSGLHAAHEAKSDSGEPLGLVHRDVSPHNILVGALGVTQLVDFGVAKANARLHESTGEGSLKGKIAYMSPEQLQGKELDRRADVYAASVVLWELLAGRRLVTVTDPAAIVAAVMNQDVEPPSRFAPASTPAIDAIVLRGLARDRDQRFATAEEMASALEGAERLASAREVSRWVEGIAGAELRETAELIADVERLSPADTSSLAQALSDEAAPTQLPADRDERRERRPGRWALATLLAALVAVATYTLWNRQGSPPAEPAASPTPAVATPAPADNGSAAPPVDSSSVSSPAPPPASQASARGPKPACIVPPQCRPPYRLTADSEKEFKPECVPYLRCFDR
jgi:serine/threonine-protein kinase